MKKIRYCLIAAASFLLIAGTIYAAYTSTVSVVNHVETGDVNIGIREYMVRGGTETVYKEPASVMPGDVISKIPRITNLADPCWVRARISIQKNGEGKEFPVIGGIPEGWKKAGEYYYYEKPLKKGEHVDLFRTVTIPADWGEKYVGQNMSITIRADAVQSKNFDPEFGAMSPWGNQQIEQCVHETDNSEPQTASGIQNTVEYSGNAHKLVAAPDDFFANLGRLMPGDSTGDSVEIKNTSDKEAELFFFAGYENQTDAQVELLKALDLQIRLNDREIYKGKLTEEGMEKGVSLGKYAPGAGGKMDFTITMPENLGNAYARRNADVKWIFAVAEDELTPTSAPSATIVPQGGTSGGGSSGGGSLASGHDAEKGAGSTVSAPIKTGDDTSVRAVIVLLLFSAFLILIIFWTKRRMNHEK